MTMGYGYDPLVILFTGFLMAIPILLTTAVAISGARSKMSHDIELPEGSYTPTKGDEIEGYKTSDMSMDWFISSLKDSGVWYDPVLNVYGPYNGIYGADLGSFKCPHVIALSAYVALTPIYHDQGQPLERREAAKALMTRIYKWGYFTRRKVSSQIALTDQDQEGTLES